ncbi:MAG TPA: DUF3379 family protein [Steroidobacteraceae bacterium]|nr:DUF3379 family protein [Steroidobacteraceae bacterium]
MNCEEARQRLSGELRAEESDLLAHLASCRDCQEYANRPSDFEKRLHRALELDAGVLAPKRAPAITASTRASPFRERPKQGRLWALAASFLVTFIVGAAVWLSRPGDVLATELVDHIIHEPQSWSRTRPLSAEELRAVLRKSHVELRSGPGTIVYANSCWFRGHYVPHLVLTTQSGPVTVMILPTEHITSPRSFTEGGYSGLIVPASIGSVAILSRKPMPLDQPAAQVVRALRASDPSSASHP